MEEESLYLESDDASQRAMHNKYDHRRNAHHRIPMRSNLHNKGTSRNGMTSLSQPLSRNKFDAIEQGSSFQKRYDQQNSHFNNKRSTNKKQIPFCFDVVDHDLMVCERTAECMRNMYVRIVVDETIVNRIQQLALSAQDFLQLQQQNLSNFYEDKKRHDIQVWLASCSEEEQKRYWERMQKS